MARIQKDTASYFPHDSDASDGDTMTVLQSRYGNNGYAFWFKLLEKLTAAEGHYLNLNNPVKWQLFVAKMGISEITTVEIMNLLVEIEAIDQELWQSKLVWCQNLVNNLADVYKNRRREIPQKPITTGNNAISTGNNGITTGVNTQSKVNKSKQKESKEDNSVVDKIIITKESVLDAYREGIGEPSEDMENEIGLACKKFTPVWVRDAIQEAVKRGRKDWRYIAGILKNWKEDAEKNKGSPDRDKYIKGKYGHLVKR